MDTAAKIAKGKRMISIIIPVYNQHEMSAECINTVRENTLVDYEFVIIDNGSEPAFKPPFTGHTETILIRNDENLGFPVAVNQGIKAARGDIIVLLNNDVIVTSGWAEKLTAWLDDFAIVGPLTNYCAGLQHITLPAYDNQEELDKEATALSEVHQDHANSVSFVIGFLMVFKKALYDEIGEFDESLWPCSGEEIDFCLRARDAGYKVGIAHDVYVHHYGSQTFDVMHKAGQLDYNEIVARNEKHLIDKWGDKARWENQIVVDEPSGCNFRNTIPGDGESIRLNLGCGTFPLKDFVNVDQFENVKPDLMADAANLPYGPGMVDEIYAGHLLEHFDYETGQRVLKYWWTLLKPGGEIRVTVPDFDVLAQQHLDNPTVASMREMNDLYMFSYVQESPHLYFYSGALLKSAIAEAGFVKLEKLPINHPYFADNVNWQVGYAGVKP